MKHRDPLAQTLLSLFVPFYILYWQYVTAKEIEDTYGHKAPSVFLLLAPMILLVAGILGFFITLFTNPSLSGGDENISSAGFIIFFLVIWPLSFLLTLVYAYKFGGNTEKVLGNEASRLLIFILLWFVAPAAVFIVQEKLNKLSENGQVPQVPAAPGQPPASENSGDTPQTPAV